MTTPATRLIPIYECQLVRVGSIRYAERHISEPAAVIELVREIVTDQLGGLDREAFVAIYLNTKNRPTGYSLISLGSLNATIVHPREVLKAAVITNANAFIIAHNHPSGDPTPSPEDRAVTRRLKEAGEILGIRLLDHIIIGHRRRFLSFALEDLL